MKGDGPNASGEPYRGHDLESGMLSRIRHWTDIFGWSRLIRVLRLAASPISIVMVGLVYGVWIIGLTVIRSIAGEAGDVVSVAWSSDPGLIVGTNWGENSWPSLLNSPTGMVWSLLLWCPIVLMIARQGALLTAGRAMEDFLMVGKRSIRRTPMAWLSSVTPIACAGVFGIGLIVIGWLSRMLGNSGWIEIPLAILMTIIALPMGILLFGSCFATPLAFAAIANEQQPDPLDSLSRGYESIYRRPLQLLLFVTVAGLLVFVIGTLACGVMHCSNVSVAFCCGLAGADSDQIARTTQLISHIPIIVSLVTGFGMLGGVYLLSRHATGEQEVEDIWTPVERPTPSMPTVGD